MQDNEFDDLFRSKLGGLEVQPSAQVWDNIVAGLGTERKRSWAPVLSIAATVLVLLAAGSWFLVDKPAKPVQNRVAQTKVKLPVNNGITETVQVEQPTKLVEPLQTASQVEQVTNRIARVKLRLTVKQKITKTVNEEPIPAPLTAETQTQQVLAAMPAQPVTHPVLPEMKLAGSTLNNDAPVLKSINTTAPVAVTASQPERKKRHGIHSLGDLINVVVSKVDKREDKLIEFTESDDDESSVTGINLGIIKIKKDK